MKKIDNRTLIGMDNLDFVEKVSKETDDREAYSIYDTSSPFDK